MIPRNERRNLISAAAAAFILIGWLSLELVWGLTPTALAETYYVASWGDDANAGTSPDAPRATPMGHRLRAGDSELYPYGDTLRVHMLIQTGSDRHTDITFGAFGDPSKGRPKIYTLAHGIHFFNNAGSFTVRNLELIADREAEGAHLSPSGVMATGSNGPILVEGCIIHEYGQNVTIQTAFPATIRYNAIFNAHGGKSGAHAQGFGGNASPLIIEGNLSFQNGGDNVGDMSLFDRNWYIYTRARDTVYLNNVSALSASSDAQLRGGGMAIGNFVWSSPLGIVLSGEEGRPARAVGNVIVQGIHDYLNGFAATNIDGVEIDGNWVIGHEAEPTTVTGVLLEAQQTPPARNVEIHGNRFLGMERDILPHRTLPEGHDWGRAHHNTSGPAVPIERMPAFLQTREGFLAWALERVDDYRTSPEPTWSAEELNRLAILAAVGLEENPAEQPRGGGDEGEGGVVVEPTPPTIGSIVETLVQKLGVPVVRGGRYYVLEVDGFDFGEAGPPRWTSPYLATLGLFEWAEKFGADRVRLDFSQTIELER